MQNGKEKLIFEGNTALEQYQVVDMVYEGRLARVLFSGRRSAAQSGLPLDDNPEPLFDYNKRFLELTDGMRPKRVLLIGGGAYTLPMALLRLLDTVRIDVVEFDPGLKAIAEQFFGLSDHERLKIFHGDGAGFLAGNTELYDLILVDAFTHDAIPASLSNSKSVGYIRDGLAPEGAAAVNIIATHRGRRSRALQQQVAIYRQVFQDIEVFPADITCSEWQLQNFILTAQKTAGTVARHLQSRPISV